MKKVGIDYWLGQTWGKLRLNSNQNLPLSLSKGCNTKFEFICECGKIGISKLAYVTKGNTKSCGHCSELSKDYWVKQHWGDLKLDTTQTLPDWWGPGTEKRYLFICNCGRKRKIPFAKVIIGSYTTCGHCNDKSKDYWLAQTWGNLKLDPKQELPNDWSRGSDKKFNFICKCGRSSLLAFGLLKTMKACGHCTDKPKEYWLSQKWGKLKLVDTPELPKEWPPSTSRKFLLICDCGASSVSPFYSITGGVKSCGCLIMGQNEFSCETSIRKFVLSLCGGDEVHSTNFPIGIKGSYDVYLPTKKLAIEYHGLIWHSERYANPEDKDYQKYLLAKSRGDRLIQIYSDEWRNKQEAIKEMLTSIISPLKGKRINPTFEIIKGKTPKEARAFLDAHHYLGAASGCITILAKYKDEIVGVWVFMKREEGTILWHRACWHPAYKTWNPHEKALKLAIPELKNLGFKRIITFSDNRFHTGELYEKLGFKFEKELKPDYGYTNGGLTRKSKYALRVKAGVNEVEAAKEKGWYRIWDSGKKRYSFNLV